MDIPHHTRTHFWCGFVVGAGCGGWWGSSLFDRTWTLFAVAVVVGLIVGTAAGRWGDRFWNWLRDRWS